MISRIEIEGVDKTGKDTVLKYIEQMTNYKYVLHARGLVSQIVYSKIYGRNHNYTDAINDNGGTLIVYLTCDKDDLKLRHKISKEPDIDIDRDMEIFEKVTDDLSNQGLRILTFNTSNWTPYQIGLKVLEFLEVCENETF